MSLGARAARGDEGAERLADRNWIKTYGWLIFAGLLFLVQVLPYLSHRWVTDESWYAGPGYSVAQGHGMRDPAIGPNDIENHFDARPPGTALAIAGSFRMLRVGQVAARLPSVLAGLLAVLLLYGLARDVIGGEGAVLATLLLATDNLMVLVSRTARPEALTTLFVLLALLAMKQYARDGRLLWAGLSGLLGAAGTMFHITLLGYLCSLALLAVMVDWRAKRGAGARGAGVRWGVSGWASAVCGVDSGCAAGAGGVSGGVPEPRGRGVAGG